MGTSMKGLLVGALLMHEGMKSMNQEKIQECIDKYNDARRFPRKTKKRMRKEAQKDYNFWMSMDAFLNEMF